MVTAAGIAIVCDIKRKHAIQLAALAVFVSLLERISNHKCLIFIVLMFVAVRVPDPKDEILDRPTFLTSRSSNTSLSLYISSVSSTRHTQILDGPLTHLGDLVHGALLPPGLMTALQSAHILSAISLHRYGSRAGSACSTRDPGEDRLPAGSPSAPWSRALDARRLAVQLDNGRHGGSVSAPGRYGPAGTSRNYSDRLPRHEGPAAQRAGFEVGSSHGYGQGELPGRIMTGSR